MDTILDFLDEIDDILEGSKPVPFSNKVSIEKVRLTDILEEIRLNLPVEIDKAQKIVTDHERIVDDAKRKAQMIIEDAREEIMRQADEHEISKMAYDRAREIVDEARRDAKEIRQNAMEYADGILEKVEDSIRKSMTMMNQSTRAIDELFNDNLDLISNNRSELQVSTKKQDPVTEGRDSRDMRERDGWDMRDGRDMR
ncbi:MAG: hypothetical protein LBS21_08540 [Clostridiales bacterium]|jgi:vacuolar-type H+-ATPase subunit H|nr:hypothetical protein [Clostridiales bacterium]